MFKFYVFSVIADILKEQFVVLGKTFWSEEKEIFIDWCFFFLHKQTK